MAGPRRAAAPWHSSPLAHLLIVIHCPTLPVFEGSPRVRLDTGHPPVDERRQEVDQGVAVPRVIREAHVDDLLGHGEEESGHQLCPGMGRAPSALRYPAQGGVSENTAGTDVPSSRFALPQRRHHHCHQRHVVGGLVVVVVDRIVVDVVAGTVVDVVAGTVVDVVGTVTGGSMGVAVANRALAR